MDKGEVWISLTVLLVIIILPVSKGMMILQEVTVILGT